MYNDRSNKTQDIHISSCFFFVDTKSCRKTAVLSGRNADVQAILRQSYIITKIYVHYFAHRLNLVIYDISKVVPYLFECYSVVSKIYTCFYLSSVISECFKSIQQQLVSGKINEPYSHLACAATLFYLFFDLTASPLWSVTNISVNLWPTSEM